MKKGTGVVPKFFSKLNFNSLVNVSIGSLIIIQIFFITGSTTNFMNLVDSSFQKTITIILAVISLLIAFSLIISFRSMMESMKDILKSAEKISEGKLNISDIIILQNNDFRLLAKTFNSMKSNLLFFVENTKNNKFDFIQFI